MSTREENKMIKSYDLDTNNHSVYKLHYHLVMTIKYRRKIITHEIAAHLRTSFQNISPAYSIKLEEFGYEQDHLHILFSAAPNSEISKFINVYKSATSRTSRKQFPAIKKKLWKNVFWSPSYFLVTTGGAPLDIIRQYVQDQSYMKDGSQ